MDRCFFFVLFIRLFFFSSFFWKICVCSAQGDTPLDPRFSLQILRLFRGMILLMFIAGSTYAESNASTGRPVNCPMKINMVLFFFCRNLSKIQTCTRRSEASTLQRTEQNYVLSSSRLPQYDRLASLGHNIMYILMYRVYS